MSRSTYYTIIISGLFMVIVSPNLFSDGMFMDGIYYATLSRNWSEGLGTFWLPYFTEHLGNPFYDHPPLVFFLQGLFFKLFGDHYIIERLYSTATYAVLVLLMIKLFKKMAIQAFQQYYWLAILLWFIVPKTIWSISNNLLENTLMLWTTSSILLTISYLENRKLSHLFLSGLLLFAGFLTKGFVALFPLSFLFFYLLSNSSFSFKNFISATLVQVSGVILPFVVLALFFYDGIISLQNYLNIQLINSLNNVSTVDSRFEIIGDFFNEILPTIILALIVFAFFRFKKLKVMNKHYNTPLILATTATILSGVLPIMISLKQRTFYLNPVFPLTAILIAVLIAPMIQQLFDKVSISKNVLKISSLSVVLMALTLNLYFATTVGRDQKRLTDIRSIIDIVGENNNMFISFEIFEEWSLYAYYHRYGKVSLDAEHPENYNFMIKAKNNLNNMPPGFEIYRDDFNEVDLYVRK